MLKTIKKDLNADVSAGTAKRVLDALRTDFWTEDFRDLPHDTEGVTLTLTYNVPDPKPVKVRPTIGTKLDFEKHTLEIGDYITEDRGSVYQVTSKERFDCKFRPGAPAYTIEPVSGNNSRETWAWLADFWTLTSAPKTHPKIGELIDFTKHDLRIGDFIKSKFSAEIYEVIGRTGTDYQTKNIVTGTPVLAYANNSWIRAEKPETRVKAKVGDRVRWTDGDEWTEGRVYEIANGYIKYIRDKVHSSSLLVGQTARLYLVDGLYYGKDTKVIAD